MKYQIEWLEQKQTKAGAKLDASLKDEQGQTISNVTLWGNTWPIATLNAGATIEGELQPAKDPKYGPTLVPMKKDNWGSRPPWANKESGAVKAANITKESVEKTLDRKELSITLAAIQRDATLLATTRVVAEQPITREMLASEWLYWKQWLINNRPNEEEYLSGRASLGF